MYITKLKIQLDGQQQTMTKAWTQKKWQTTLAANHFS